MKVILCVYPQTPTLLDYGEVLLSLHPLERRTTHLFSYICELSLLYSALATPPPSKLACAALLLTRVLHQYGNAHIQHASLEKCDANIFNLIPFVILVEHKVTLNYACLSPSLQLPSGPAS